MHPFFKTALPCLLVGLFFIVGCSKDSNTGTNNPQPASVVGTWSRNEPGFPVHYVFQSNNTYTITVDPDMYSESGTYTTSGSSVTMTPTYCSAIGVTEQCNGPTTATISGNQMAVPGNGDPSGVVTKQ